MSTVSKSGAGKRLNLQPIVVEEQKSISDDNNSLIKEGKLPENQEKHPERMREEKKKSTS